MRAIYVGNLSYNFLEQNLECEITKNMQNHFAKNMLLLNFYEKTKNAEYEQKK
jgi:hypothetical protein